MDTACKDAECRVLHWLPRPQHFNNKFGAAWEMNNSKHEVPVRK